MTNVHVLVIDNFDSFTYNLVESLQTHGATTTIFRNHTSVVTILERLKHIEGPKCLLISPGPKSPDKAGYCLAYIKALKQVCPIFGICLGHQAIGQVFGGQVYQVEAYHGQSSEIKHDEDRLFHHVPQRFQAGRYHSLAVTCPISFKPIAKYGQLTMAMRHKQLPIYGLQFHPESILTDYGDQIIQNILTIAQEEYPYVS